MSLYGGMVVCQRQELGIETHQPLKPCAMLVDGFSIKGTLHQHALHKALVVGASRCRVTASPSLPPTSRGQQRQQTVSPSEIPVVRASKL